MKTHIANPAGDIGEEGGTTQSFPKYITGINGIS